MELNIGLVLVSTDFSEAGDRAIPFAYWLAKDHGASVVLVHVLDAAPVPSPLYAHYYPTLTAEQLATIEQEARTALEQRIPASFRNSVRSDTAISHGDAAHAIVELAEKRGASIVVISTHGRTGLKHLLLGSVAERVIRHAPCPVLVVRRIDATKPRASS